MQDIDALTKRIILIGKGKILLDGTLDDLKGQYKDASSLDKMMVKLYEAYKI
jgi:ABC-2 type transport system ATP-binding protein